MHADGHVLNYERMCGYIGLWAGILYALSLGREGKFFFNAHVLINVIERL